jgi:sortase A
VRTAIRGLGEVFISLGIVILLFVVYQLYWTGVLARQAMADELAKLDAKAKVARTAPAQPETTPANTAPAPEPYTFDEPFARMYIPRFGSKWEKPIISGTDADQLKRGLGWYYNSGLVGQEGNFAVAGHRKTYGDPFLNFPKLRVGDKIVVQDATNYYIYSLDRPVVNENEKQDKVVYRTIPEDVHVVDPVPEKAYTAPGKYITLTTCDPEWGSSHRLIAWGHLESVWPVSAGEPEALRGGNS